MHSLLRNPLWQTARESRKRQQLAGWLSGICLAVGMLALLDGLFAQMRQGNNELEFLRGQAITISGPVAIKNPVRSDLIQRFQPENAPLTFDFEGYFTGYWFGNGMWRGQIRADSEAEPGSYQLVISFRGSSRSSQTWVLRLFADQASLRAASRSYIYRWFGANPFILAAISAACGIILGIVTYFFGRRFATALRILGLSEIYSVEPQESLVWCLAPESLAPRPGIARIILDCDGHVFGEARSIAWKKGRLKLAVMDERTIPKGALICLKHPAENPAKPVTV